ncbi:hypothetical protein D3C83_181170 [compost metagenome]
MKLSVGAVIARIPPMFTFGSTTAALVSVNPFCLTSNPSTVTVTFSGTINAVRLVRLKIV